MKALLVHSDLRQRGGAEDYAIAFRMALEAKGWMTTVLDVNGLSENDILINDSPVLRFSRSLYPFKNLSLFKYAIVCRYMRFLRLEYDLVVYTYGEGPKMGCKTVRIMHAPGLFSTLAEMLSYLGVDNKSQFHLLGRQFYAWSCRIIAGPSTEENPKTITITNSKWTKGIVSRIWGIKNPLVLYPRVSLDTDVHAAKQEKARLSFIALGRIVPNKRLEDAIFIVDQLRGRGHDCELNIVGRSNTPYAQHLVETYRENPAITFHPDASDEDKTALIARAQFGLHCYRNEHFGIAVAEMLLLGCIPIVFNGGGVTELVEDSRQRYSTLEEAVDNISLLLNLSEGELQSLSTAQMENEALVRAADFDFEIKNIIDRISDELGAGEIV